jgi:hypothetical protein
MKNLKKSLIFSTLLLISFVLFADNDDLTLEGVITSSEKNVPNELIVIYSNDGVVDSLYSDEIGNFNVSLDFDKRYVFVIGKEKYTTKWIEVSTEIPAKYRKKDHKVLFYIELEPVKVMRASTN